MNKEKYTGNSNKIWSNWTIKQRKHFLKDHTFPQMNSVVDTFSDLSKEIQSAISQHIKDGKYAGGGNINSEKVYDVKYVAKDRVKLKKSMKGSMTAVIKAVSREDALAKVKSENDDFGKLISIKVTKMNPDFFEKGGGITKSVKELDKGIEKLKSEIKKQDDDIARYQKNIDDINETKAKLMLKLNEKEKTTSDSMMPWQKELSQDEIEFIVSAINRYGNRQHPKATVINWVDYKFSYVKDVLSEIKTPNMERSSTGNPLNENGTLIMFALIKKFKIK